MDGTTYTIEGRGLDGRNACLVRVRWEAADLVSDVITDILQDRIRKLLDKVKAMDDLVDPANAYDVGLTEMFGQSLTIEGQDGNGRSLGCLVRQYYEIAHCVGIGAGEELENGLQDIIHEAEKMLFRAVKVPDDTETRV